MNTMDAVMNVEMGSCDEDTYIKSMQHLIDTSVVWSLEAFFGYRAIEMIEDGTCTAPDWVDLNE